MFLLRYLAAAALALALTACQTTSQVTSLDAKLRDKCGYLISGVRIARVATAFSPSAAPLVEQGSALIDAYCGSKPITDIASAMEAMERVIVAVRPLAPAR